MAQKAGRVGVDPSQVDLFGKIVGGGGTSDAYTKAEADDKFLAKTDASSTYETQAHASNTYETKTDAADLQPKNLAVPIHMLSGSILTVEGMFAGDQDAYTNKQLTDRVPVFKVSDDVVTNGQVSFTHIDDTGLHLYELCFSVGSGTVNLNPTSKILSVSQPLTNNMSITYITDADEGSWAYLLITRQ